MRKKIKTYKFLCIKLTINSYLQNFIEIKFVKSYYISFGLKKLESLRSIIYALKFREQDFIRQPFTCTEKMLALLCQY